MLEQARPLYALRMLAPGHFTLAKFTMPDFTVEATYNLTAKGTGYACDCPASARVVKYKPCKHQRMLPFMLGACNTDRFYEPESRSWCQPLAPDLAADANLPATAADYAAIIGPLTNGLLDDMPMKEVVGEAAQQSGAPIEPPKYPKPELSEAALQMLEEAKRAPFAPEAPKLRRRV